MQMLSTSDPSRAAQKQLTVVWASPRLARVMPSLVCAYATSAVVQRQDGGIVQRLLHEDSMIVLGWKAMAEW